MRISHIGFVVSKHLANAPQPLATNAQARELQSVRRRNNLQTLHRPMDTINKPQDLDPPAACFADIKTSVAKGDAGGLIEFAGQIAGGSATDCPHEHPLAKIENLDHVVVGICNEAQVLMRRKGLWVA